MLPKTQRLTKADFDHYFKTGKRIHSPHLQLIYSPSPHFHGAVVVGKKVYKRAHDRNMLRRRLYGVLYRHHKTHQQTGVYIMIAKPPISSRSNAEAILEAHELLNKTVKV